MGDEVRRRVRRGACAQSSRAKIFLIKKKGTGCEKAKRVVVPVQRERRLLHVFFFFPPPSPDLVPCGAVFFCKSKTEYSSPNDLHFLVLFTMDDVPCGHN